MEDSYCRAQQAHELCGVSVYSGNRMDDASVRPYLLVVGIGCTALLAGFFVFFQSKRAPTILPIETSLPIKTVFESTITVDIEGAVNHPGVVRLHAPATETIRFVDVLTQAGGFTSDADLGYIEKNINKAAPVTDGSKIYIPRVGEKSQSIRGDGKVNINTASSEQLQRLKGIGEGRATAIIEARPYQSIDELKEKANIPASVLSTIRDDITL